MNENILFTGTGKGVPLNQLPPEAWQTTGGTDTSGLAKRYATVATLYRGVEIRAQAVATMPYDILGSDGKVVYESESGEKFPAGLEFMTDFPDLLARTEAAVSLEGGAYWEKQRNQVRTRSLKWLLPGSVTPVYNQPSKPGFDPTLPIGALLYFSRELGAPIPPIRLEIDDVLYFWPPNWEVETGPSKNTPGKAAFAAAGVLGSMDTFLTDYFDRGLIKATILTQDPEGAAMYGQISDAEIEDFKNWWKRVITGVKNAFTTRVLRSDIKPVVIGEGLNDLSDSELSQDERQDVAVALGVPQSKLFANAANFSTKQSDDVQFITDTVLPECRWIYGAINKQLFEPMGLTITTRPQRLTVMQADESDRAQSLLHLVSSGVPVVLAMDLLGYEMTEEQRTELEVQEVVVDPVGQVLNEQAGGGQEPQEIRSISDFLKGQEVRRLQRWATTRDKPNPLEFKSDVLTATEIETVVVGVADSQDAPFPSWDDYP